MAEKRGSVPSNPDMKKTKEKEIPEFKRKSVMIDNKLPVMKTSKANKDSIHKTHDSRKNIINADGSDNIEYLRKTNEAQKAIITETENELNKYKEKYEKKKKKKKIRRKFKR